MKPVLALFLASIAGCSLLTGCGARELPALPPAPIILKLPDCPAPTPPVLPVLDAALPLDNPENLETLLIRDDVIRAYLRGLEAAVNCYKRRSHEPR